MKTLVIGGTGTVGSQVVKYLLKEKQAVRVLTTSITNAARLPKAVEAVTGDLDVPATLTKTFRGVDKIFMLNAQSHTEVQQGLNAIEAAKKAGVAKIVYQSIHNVRMAPEIPHFQPKIRIEEAIIASGLSYTFICPNNFYQNDYWFKEAIVNYGVYPQPFGDIGLSRVDVRDIAEVAVKTLISDELDGQSISLVGPQVLNGQTTAAILSEQLGFQVVYAGNDLESWAAQAKRSLPEWKVEDWKEMYHLFQKEGVKATPEELDKLTSILGRAPRSYTDFIKENISTFSRELANA